MVASIGTGRRAGRWMGRRAGARGWAAAAGLACAAALGGCSVGLPLHESTLTLNAEPGTDAVVPSLDVRSGNGSLRIRKSDVRQVEITAQVAAESAERLERTRLVADRLPDGTLKVYVEWPDGKRRSRERAALEVLVPGAGGVLADTTNGEIFVEGLSGDARLDTSNGSITVVDHAGDVWADTSNGRIEVRGAGGVRADTSNGRIELRGVRGAVWADTSNGRIDVELTPENPGPAELSTSNGSARLVVGPAFVGRMTLGTSNGSVVADVAGGARVIELGKKRAVIEFGPEGVDAPASRIGTSNGSVEVRLGP